MAEDITVTFQGGAFVPDLPVHVAPGTRAKVVLEERAEAEEAEEAEQRKLRQEAFARFQELCDRLSFNSGGLKLTRDELQERRCYERPLNVVANEM